MTSRPAGAHKTGLIGPVGLSGGVILLVMAPLLRGGNRHAALIVIEALGLFIIMCVCARFSKAPPTASREPVLTVGARRLLYVSPAVLALIYLTPVPANFWSGLAGRSAYVALMAEAGLAAPARLPLSLVPDASMVSLLAGIPLVAAFMMGLNLRARQFDLLARVIVISAFAQVALGLLQVGGGPNSALFFGNDGSRPIGTFANSNHFANYIAMALVPYIWLARESVASISSRGRSGLAGLTARHATALWVFGGLILVLGVLVSRSRGAALTGLPLAGLALGLVYLLDAQRQAGGGVRLAIVAGIGIVAAAVALMGLDAVTSRFGASDFANSASFRTLLARTTLAGAAEFWPWGAGWGTYAAVYPKFQPPSIAGIAPHAHQDYAQMLFEGGVFALVLAAAFLWLVVGRAVVLVRAAWREESLGRDAQIAALCGLGLLGFLLHSLVEFNMHIPANAILASLLAGVYLRPLDTRGQGSSRDRPSLPHTSRH